MLVRGPIKIWQNKTEDNFWYTYALKAYFKNCLFFFSRGGHADNYSRATLWP